MSDQDPSTQTDPAMVIDDVRAMMERLGGFYGAEAGSDDDGPCVDVRMVPGSEPALESVQARFANIRFKAIAYVLEPQ